VNFRIADTFTESLAKLSGDEQKAVKTTAFDLQLNPAKPGMQLYKLTGARDPNFWSVRVSGDHRPGRSHRQRPALRAAREGLRAHPAHRRLQDHGR